MNQHMNFRSSVLLLLVAGTAVPAYGDDLPDKVPAQLRDRALSTLRNGLNTETKWVKVHAAEALIWHGYPDDIGTMFAAEAATADPQYRIGCLRVLAQAAMVTLEVPPAYGPLHSLVIGDSLQIKDGMVLPPERPGLGVELTDDVKNRFPFVPGSGEFNDFAGKNIVDYDGRVAQLVDTSKW